MVNDTPDTPIVLVGRDMEIDSTEAIIIPTTSCFTTGVKKIKLDQQDQSFLQQKSPPPPVTSEEPVGELPGTSSSRVDILQEFQFPPVDLQNFVKSGKASSVEEIMEMLSTPASNFVNHQKRDNMSTAHLCPNLKRPRLITNRGNIKSLYGFEIDAETYLHPEEALYLMEIGKLEILIEGVPLSVERGRLLFLQSSQIPSCATADYAVYKHFSKLGYRVHRRPEYLSSYPIPQQGSEAGYPMEEDKDSTRTEKSSASMDVGGSSRGTKRRAEAEPKDEVDEASDSDCSSSVESMEGAAAIVEDEDSDCEFLEEVERVSKADDLDEDEVLFGEVTMDLPLPPDSQSPPPYTVVESDSDVEFLDEVSFFGVIIEELSSETDSSSVYFEAGPSTSKGTQVFVDLVSSDSEGEEVSEYYEPIWSKCVPNSKIHVMFPPPGLLPDNILPRDASTVYEFNMFNNPQQPQQETSSEDLEIETIVDNLRLENVTPTFESSGGSWKEWRQNAMEEARHVVNDSLLGKPAPSVGADPKNAVDKKLHQWNPPTATESAQARRDRKSLHMPYDLYPQSAGQVHRDKLGVIVKPIHRIAVVRSEELIPDIGEFPTDEEEPPLLVTVVGEDASVIQLLCNAVPIPSLF